jgi:hypothetical protein
VSVAIVAGETGGAITSTSAKGMVAATGWRGGFVVLREVKWTVFVDAASERMGSASVGVEVSGSRARVWRCRRGMGTSIPLLVRS